MVAGKPAIDPIKMYNPETGDCMLAEDYKRTVRKAFPRGTEPTEVFWLALADMVSKFRIMQKCRAMRRPPAAEIKRWKRIARLAKEVVQDATSAQVTILLNLD